MISSKSSFFALFRPAACFLPLFLLLLLVLVACRPEDLLTPPRLATQTAVAQLTATPTANPVVLPAPSPSLQITPEIPPDIQSIPSITVWINETSPEHEAALQKMVADFTQTNHIDVELKLVRPALLPELLATAVLSYPETLPDIVFMPLEYTVGWAEKGLLDPSAADEVLDVLGRDTFNPAALSLVQTGGQAAAIPDDGTQQLILYRQDWFEAQKLAVPDTYEAMLKAAEALYKPDDLVYGVVIPTESNLVSTHQAFEQIATANNCQLVDDEGQVQILQAACQEALDFYFNLIHNYSPPGVQTDTSARNAYLTGRTGLIMTSASILPMLAGVGDVPDNCPACADGELAQVTAVLTHLKGSGAQAQAANFGNLRYMGITKKADRATAVAFATYWFNTAYPDWLAIETERKVPLRWGTSESPRQFIDNWGILPIGNSDQSLTDLYGAEVVAQLRDHVADGPRWGFHEQQGRLMSDIYQKLTFSIVLQEMLSGYFTTNQTLFEAYLRVTGLIPNYAFPLVPTPTPEE